MVYALLSSLSSRARPRAGRDTRPWAVSLTCILVLLGCASAPARPRAPASDTTIAAPATACPAPAGTGATSTPPLEDSGLPTFWQYAVADYFQGIPAAIDLASHPDAARFADRLTAKLDQGPNFAGSYRLVSWGCGTQCTTSMIVDLRSGVVHDGVTAELDMHFRADSALLIVNPHPEKSFEIGEIPPWAGTRYYRWHQDRLELLGPHFRPSPR